MDYFATNKMVTNPSKTGLLILRPSKIQEKSASIKIAGENISEIQETKILGLWVTNDLKWKKQVDTLVSETNYSLSVLRRLQKFLSDRELKMLAEGMIMSKIRYCAAVYGSEWIRMKEEDPLSAMQCTIQKIQNNALRIITNNKRSDHVRITDMLKATGWQSINQIVSYASLIEMWKAKAFEVPYLDSLLQLKHNEYQSLRSNKKDILKSTIDEPFANIVEKLYNMSTDRFKQTNLIVNAKNEARILVNTLPI